MGLVSVLDGQGLDASVRRIMRQSVLLYDDEAARARELIAPWPGATTLLLAGMRLEAWDGTRWVPLGGGVSVVPRMYLDDLLDVQLTNPATRPTNAPNVLIWSASRNVWVDSILELNDMNDVVITGFPSVGQVLTYQGPLNGWRPATPATGGLDQATADARYVNLDGDTMTGILNMGNSQIKSVGAPSQITDAANKGYVDNLFDARPWKMPVRLATTANLAAISGLAAIDGVTPAAGDRILVKDQTTQSQNGIYIAASGTWTRASDADGSGELNGAVVLVREGTTQADTAWMVTTDGNIVPPATNVWAKAFPAAAAAQPLDWLTDVTIASPANAQGLIYDSASSQWKNQAIPAQYTEVDWSASLVWNGATPGAGYITKAWYTKIGNWVFFNIFLSFGTTGLNGGTGALSFNLPFAAAASAEVVGVCKTYIPGGAAAANWNGMCYIPGGGSTIYPLFPQSTTNASVNSWRGADGSAAAGTGIPQIPGQYSVQANGNISISVQYKV